MGNWSKILHWYFIAICLDRKDILEWMLRELTTEEILTFNGGYITTYALLDMDITNDFIEAGKLKEATEFFMGVCEKKDAYMVKDDLSVFQYKDDYGNLLEFSPYWLLEYAYLMGEEKARVLLGEQLMRLDKELKKGLFEKPSDKMRSSKSSLS